MDFRRFDNLPQYIKKHIINNRTYIRIHKDNIIITEHDIIYLINYKLDELVSCIKYLNKRWCHQREKVDLSGSAHESRCYICKFAHLFLNAEAKCLKPQRRAEVTNKEWKNDIFSEFEWMNKYLDLYDIFHSKIEKSPSEYWKMHLIAYRLLRYAKNDLEKICGVGCTVCTSKLDLLYYMFELRQEYEIPGFLNYCDNIDDFTWIYDVPGDKFYFPYSHINFIKLRNLNILSECETL